MKFLSSLDRKDRRLLLWCLAFAVLLAAITGFVVPGENSNDDRVPSSYLSGQHGAMAAYDTLVRSGYPVERWERPLAELAATAGPGTVVVFAQPFTREPDDIKAVRDILERGARVLATGFWGGYILPGESSGTPREFTFAACRLEPEGLDSMAGSGEVWMIPEAAWQVGKPSDRVQYSCAGQPAVVEYDWSKGHVVWWASATPLENGSIARANNLDLFLNSLGPMQGHRFYWDESLHGEVRSDWSFASGPALWMLRLGLPALAALVVFSFSRRSGPMRELPAAPRATPIEFIDALGSLYRNAGAASAASDDSLGALSPPCPGSLRTPRPADERSELAAALRRRFPTLNSTLEADLEACEDALDEKATDPRAALRLVQLLHDYQAQLEAAARPDLHVNRGRKRRTPPSARKGFMTQDLPPSPHPETSGPSSEDPSQDSLGPSTACMRPPN